MCRLCCVCEEWDSQLSEKFYPVKGKFVCPSCSQVIASEYLGGILVLAEGCWDTARSAARRLSAILKSLEFEARYNDSFSELYEKVKVQRDKVKL